VKTHPSGEQLYRDQATKQHAHRLFELLKLTPPTDIDTKYLPSELRTFTHDMSTLFECFHQFTALASELPRIPDEGVVEGLQVSFDKTFDPLTRID
jgi:hypothetical protein